LTSREKCPLSETLPFLWGMAKRKKKTGKGDIAETVW
jgi:hypothetical protein